MDIISKVANRLKLSKEEKAKLRATVSLAGVSSEKAVEAIVAGIRKGEAATVEAKKLISKTVDYPRRIDECPICYANMQPITLAGNRQATFCPVHNVVMPTIE